MIKLMKILTELEPPKQVYAPGQGPSDSEEEFVQKGYRTKSKTDPETGRVESDVEYLPRFEEIRRNLQKYRKEFQPFRFSSSPDIAKNAKDVNTLLTKASQLIFALDKMIELERKNR